MAQYSKPIGPSRPVGYDTQGKPVFPQNIEKKGDKIYTAPDWSNPSNTPVRYSGGGSGSSGSYGGSSSSAQAQAEALAQAQAKAQAEAKARAEEQARQQAQIEQARQKFQASLRNVKGISGQQSAREQFNKQVSQIQAGKNLNQISTTTPKPTTTTNKYIVKAGGSVTELNQETGGSRYVGSAYIPELGMTAREYSKKITDEAVKTGIVDKKDLYKSRIRVEEPIASTTSQTIPADKINNIASSNSQYNILTNKRNIIDTSSKFLKNFDVLGIASGIKNLYVLETKRANDTKKSLLPKSLTTGLDEINPPNNSGGFSLAQKYYETTGKLWNWISGGKIKEPKFYSSGEREKLVEQGLFNFSSADTFETQEKAIKDLRDKGIKINLKTNPLTNQTYYEIDSKSAYNSLASTSKIGNILVGITDIGFKSALFEPLMSSGTSNTKAKVKAKQEVVYVRRFSSDAETNAAYENAVNKLRTTATRKDLTEAYRKAVLTKDTTKINQIKDVLKDVAGENIALEIIRDVNAQELGGTSFITGKTTTPTTVVKPIKTEVIFNIENLPQNIKTTTPTTSSSLVNDKQDLGSNIFEQNKLGAGQNMFSNVEQTSNRFSDLGTSTSNRLKLLESTGSKSKETQKNVLGLKSESVQKNLSKSQELLKSKSGLKEALTLASLLKTSQALKSQEVFKQPQKQKSKQKPKEQKKPIPKYPKGILSAIAKVKKMSKESPELFEVFVKKLGKDVSIGIAKTKKEAESILSSELKTTLRASGFVKKGGKRLTAKELDLFGTGFTQSKSDIFRIVQPKTQRLGTKSETREIQYFKKSPTKKQKTASYFFGGI